MKQLIGLLVMVSLLVGVSGCGIDLNIFEETDWIDDVFLLKTDGQGNQEWRKTFGGGLGRSVQQTVDGGFIVAGFFYDEE